MNDRLVAILLEGKILCPCMATLGYPKAPDVLPCTCEITKTRARFMITTKKECCANGTCLVFQALPDEASEEASVYDQQRS